MSAPEITDKLNAFLAAHRPLTEECHAVYIMVEARKLIEHFGVQLPLLRYYADWTLHTEKSYGVTHISVVTASVYDALVDGLEFPDRISATRSELSAFFKMRVLKGQFATFLNRFRIDQSLTNDEELWGEFVRLLTLVLADQPINNPCGKGHNLAELRFLPQGGVEFIFRRPINAHSSFQYSIH